MPQFDAASVLALLSKLAARAVAGQFSLTVQPTSQPYVDHAVAPLLRPQGSPPYSLVTVAAVYRSPDRVLTTLDGGRVAVIDGKPTVMPIQVTSGGVQRRFLPASVVCDPSNILVAQGSLLLWMQAQFDWWDQQQKQGGMAPVLVP